MDNIKKPTVALLDIDRLIYSIGFTVEGKDEPDSHICHSAKLMLKGLKDEVLEIVPTIERFNVIISDTRNFRKMIEDIEKPYKGHRASKPAAYDLVRSYYMEHHGARCNPYMEADDVVAMLHHKSHRNGKYNTLVVDVDKDSLNTVGWNLSPSIKRGGEVIRKPKFQFVEEFQATQHFYKQLLTGDGTDNIQGVAGIGEKKALAILEGSRCENELFVRVLDIYLDNYPDDCYSEIIHKMIQRGNLLHMRRWPGDFWNIPRQHQL